jgi:hypothetical protein
MWTPISDDVLYRKTNAYRFYRCTCGTERWVRVQAVQQGTSKDCGCHRAQQARERLIARHQQGWIASGAGRPKGRVALEVEYRYWSVGRQRWGEWDFYAKVSPSKVEALLAKSTPDLSYRIKPTTVSFHHEK